MGTHVHLAQDWVLSMRRGIICQQIRKNVQGLGVEVPLTEVSEKRDIQASTREEKTMTFICQEAAFCGCVLLTFAVKRPRRQNNPAALSVNLN